MVDNSMVLKRLNVKVCNVMHRKSCVHGEAGQLLNPSFRMMRCHIRQTIPEMTTSTTGCIGFRQPNTLWDVWRVMNPIGNKRAPNHTTRFICAKAGSSKRGDPHGDGTPIRDFKRTTTIPRSQRGSLRRQARVYARYPYTGKVSGSF
jgi:hypothetical protein